MLVFLAVSILTGFSRHLSLSFVCTYLIPFCNSWHFFCHFCIHFHTLLHTLHFPLPLFFLFSYFLPSFSVYFVRLAKIQWHSAQRLFLKVIYWVIFLGTFFPSTFKWFMDFNWVFITNYYRQSLSLLYFIWSIIWFVLHRPFSNFGANTASLCGKNSIFA